MQKIYNNNFFGLLLGISGYSLFVFLDTIIKKYLVQQYPIFEITFFICLFSFIPILTTITVVGNWNRLVNNKIHIQILRGILAIICGSLIINSFRYHALFEIYPVLFATPLILTSLSYFFLKEKISKLRWSVVLIGFIGVLIVSRPGTFHFTLAIMGLFIGAFILAINVLIIRFLANSQSSIAFAFYGSVAGLFVSGIISYFNYVPITLTDLLILILCGIIGGTAGLCISGASKILESSLFAPIQYVQLVVGFVLSYIFFYDIPDKFEVIGSFIIVCSGLFLIYRENKLKIRPLVSKKSRTRDMFLRGH